MDGLQFLTKNEYQNLIKKLDLTEDDYQELFILEHSRRNDLTNEGIMMELRISKYRLQQIKTELKIKMLRLASN